MQISIAGGHGQIAMLLGARLAAAGHEVHGLIRNRDQVADLQDRGVTPVLLDLELRLASDYAAAIEHSDAVVFAAGAGPGSGAARKETVDHDAAVKLIHACQEVGVDRYVMISSRGTADPPMDDSVFSFYLRAKARADEFLMSTDLRWTIVRPGRLTDEPPTGLVQVGDTAPSAEISRADVAAVLHRVLERDDLEGVLFELSGGDRPIEDTLDDVAR